MDEKETQ